MFTWLRDRRRRRLLATPFPPHWEPILRRNVAHAGHLTAGQGKALRDTLRVFLSETRFEGGGGFVVTDEVRVTVSAFAALLVLGLGVDYLRRVGVVIVYANAFRTPNPDDDWEDDELSDEQFAGQAVYRGPVIVSWSELKAEGRDVGTGVNVMLHELAHQLDFLDGATDGTPPLPTDAVRRQWAGVMRAAFDRHTQALRRGRETFFSEHAGDDATEFFADATEAFFCAPHDLAFEEPAVYDLLAAFYQLDPRAWFPEA